MSKEDKLFRILFLTSILILVANDFYFKYKFHNDLTGKISDFAGLFAFPYFISTLFKRRIKTIYFVTGILFIWWKTNYSQGFIDFANENGFLVNRIIDYSDLLALIILPASYVYWKSDKNFQLLSKKIFRPIIIAICCFAFVATTLQRKSEDYNIKSDYKINTEMNFDNAKLKLGIINSDSLEAIYYPIKFPKREANILTRINLLKNSNGNLVIELDSILNYSIPNKGNLFWSIYDKEDVKYFERLTKKEIEDFFLHQIENELGEK